MASSSNIPAPDAVQVVVSALADDSPLVRQASMASLRDIAKLNPLLVLDCCSSVSRGGRRRFGNISGVFQVMAFAVGAMDKEDVDPAYMLKLAKIATAEMISSKEYDVQWQRTASSLLVSIGKHFPDLMMEEVFLHLSGTSSNSPSMIQVLADFASSDALQFTPRLKGVLSRVLPIIGNVKDVHRPIFANAFTCWCQAVCQYSADYTSQFLLDGDVMSYFHSAFELLLRVWATSRELKVRMASVEALGQMVGLVSRIQLKTAVPRLVPTILELLKKDQEIALVATRSLRNVLNASLLLDTGPPLLDFEDLIVVLSTLLPVVCFNGESNERSGFSVGLKTYNEVQHCFLSVGLVYPEDLFTFLLNKCRLKEEPLTYSSLCALKHLLPRLTEAWHSKRPLLVEVVESLLDEHSLGVRKALSELIVVMASHCYLIGHSGEILVEFLVRNCGLSDQEMVETKSNNAHYPFLLKKSEVKIACIQPMELRAICEKSLLLLTITIPEMEYILWPFLLKTITPRIYTGAVATVCRCISELCKLRSTQNHSLIDECKARSDIPKPEELLARLIVLLHDPLAKDQIAYQILTVLCYLAPLFPKNINLFWQDEIPKMKTYIGDTEDLKQDSSYQETWDDMIINFLAESLDVIQDTDWLMSLGNVFAEQYELYTTDDEHSALLHRCLGVLLQRVDDRYYVKNKIDWMYAHSNIAFPMNRLGLAKAMGLVAASHLDTVLGKLKNILDSMGQSFIQRFLSLFSDSIATEESDDIHAALALMYGYAARYAPTTVIEARIDALVGTNMLSRLLHVQHPMAKQAVITAIDLLGRAVINASEGGASFPLKKRDQLLDYVLTLMGLDDSEGYVDSGVEFLHTQALALSACTTLVSVEPKLTVETRNYVMKATLGFFALPSDPADVIDPLIKNLVTLLCAILVTRVTSLLADLRSFKMLVYSSYNLQTNLVRQKVVEVCLIHGLPECGSYQKLSCLGGFSILFLLDSSSFSGEDGRSRAELLLYILRQIDQYVSSTVECQRKRGCFAALQLLLKFRALCASGHCSLGCLGSCLHGKHNDRLVHGNLSNLPSAFVLPNRDALCVGDRVIMYLRRCADSNSEVRKHSAQILDQFFSIALSLPRPVAASFDPAIELSYRALSSLEDVIAILRSDASIDPSEVFNRVVSSVCVLLTKDELVATLHGCSTAICDKVKQSAEGTILAINEFVTKRGNELNEVDISRTAQSLLHATDYVTDKHLRLEILGAISCLAEVTHPTIVFNEVLIAAEKDIMRKDITRLRGGWPKQEAFHAFSQHSVLSFLFLEHVISILNNQTPIGKVETFKGDNVGPPVDAHTEDNLLRAAIVALTAFFRGGGKIGKKAVEQKYAIVLAALTVHLGSCYNKASSGQAETLRDLLTAFQAFCECVGDLEMGKFLAREGVQNENENEKWIVLIGDIAGCISIKRPKEVSTISLLLSKSLNRPVKFEREAAAAALSEFVRYSEQFDSLLEQIVEALCRHVSDESAAVRRLCLRGLVQIPSVQLVRYASQVLGVIVALLGDLDESVQLTAVSCLLMVLESSDKEAVDPVLPSLYVHVRNLQVSTSSKMRAYAFAAFGALSDFGVLANREAFIEQAHNAFPRLILHLHDDDFNVRNACRSTLRRITPLLELEGVSALFNMHCFNSDHRSDYEDFVRDLTRQLCENLPSKVDTYMASIVQAFDSPSPAIQANAIYFSSSILCLSEDQRISSLYYSQVFSLLVSKMSKSPDAIVRATCSSALGLLLMSTKLQLWRDSRLDHGGSSQWSQDSDSVRR